MALVRYEPLNLLSQMLSDRNKFFDRIMGVPFAEDTSAVETSRWLPSVDIKEEPNQFVLYADVPGVDPKDIDVHMERNLLTIRGTRKSEKKEETNNYTREERFFGSFHCQFTFSDIVDAENIKANCKNGVLKVIIPKKEAIKARR